jgi:hypothetical protein
MRKRPMAGKYLEQCSHVSLSIHDQISRLCSQGAVSEGTLTELTAPVCRSKSPNDAHGTTVIFLRQKTHGFSGSPRVFSQSSILLVCSRIWSRGLGSFVALSLRCDPNWLFRPRL